MKPFRLLSLLLCLCPFAVYAQTAEVGGAVQDPSGAVVPKASVEFRNQDTGIRRQTTTNGDGIYHLVGMNPGKYDATVQAKGFKTLTREDVTFQVGDKAQVDFKMQVGQTSESVTVDGSGLQINTTDASVSTVIDRKFVENTPLNGRSFQSLILLTPGAVTNSPQRSSSIGNSGEFSINGQRTESNYYTVDGVSANSGTSVVVAGAGPTGSLPASTALGTTQSLVSVDALQEFRVESSTYSAEYGRNPGGQFSFVTRSGTNDWHGTAFDYFRNEALDANSWFNDNTVPVTRKTPERQNDFGGTLGGPIRIPLLYDGRNRSFFFFSYEGLRLMQPQAVSVNYVPNMALRQSAPGMLRQVLNAFPLPTPNAPDLGNGLGEFISSWSNPSKADAISIRLDHNLGQRAHLFFRFSDTPSTGNSRGSATTYYSPATVISGEYLSRTYTLGASGNIARNMDNDFRLNFSSNKLQSKYTNDTFGGAVPVSLIQLQNVSNGATVAMALSFGAYYQKVQESSSGATQQQWNLVDTVNIIRGKHAIKIGIDWRRLTPFIQQPSPNVLYSYSGAASVTSNRVDTGSAATYAPFYPVYTNFSAFVQDSWRAGPRVTLSTGVRWDVNPAPGVSQGLMPYTVIGLDNPSTMTLAPQGTPLWKTGWYNLAPRVGVAYVLNSDPGWETVLRGGGGVFFDTGQQAGSYGFGGAGFSAGGFFGTSYKVPVSFPAPVSMVTPIITTPPTAPYTYIYANPPHLQLPYTFQWNASVEQALGRTQSFTISYVGANGRKLLRESFSHISAVNPNFNYLYVFNNGLTSSYNGLQVKFQRQVIRGLQALASYTWSHSFDYGSYNAAYPYQRGNSDYDVRHNATAAVSYELPHSGDSAWLRAFTSDWGVDGRFTTRTGFPITFNGTGTFDPSTFSFSYGGLNLVPGVPLFVYGTRSTYPGGRRINSSAFALPPTGQPGNAPRNFVDGFGAVQTDVAIRRVFPIRDRLQGQFRAEAFNVFNHPNFGAINSTYGSAQFGLATASLSQSLGTLSPVYQMGGPRSLQLTLKLTF